MAVPKIWRKIPEQYNLIGRICNECHEKYFPVRTVCKKCGNFDLDNYKFKGIGKIITYTVIRTPTTDPENENTDIYARHIPYVLAIVKLDEGPMVTTQIVDSKASDIKIGAKVKRVFRKIVEKGEKGVIQYGYKFRIA